MLHRRRQRLEELARKEADGVSFWTAKFDTAVRNRILYALVDAAGSLYCEDAEARARGAILRDEGWTSLPGTTRSRPHEQFLEFVGTCSDELMPTAIEAMHFALERMESDYLNGFDPRQSMMAFDQQARTVLREHRISFDLIDGQMVPLESQELHEAVVKPVVTLLATNQKLARVEKAYRDALNELAAGKPEDAITDAGTALQEMLVARGATGNALGPLIKSARTMKLLAPHDSTLTDAIEKAMHWASANRSETGDAHRAIEPNPEDAWLMVHIVGALIARLAHDSKRS